MWVDIGGKDLHFVGLLERLDLFLQHDGHGVGLLAGGTAAHPDPEDVTGGPARKKTGNHLRPQHLEDFRVSEKTRDADEQIPEQSLCLRRVFLQKPQIVLFLEDLVDGHAPLHLAHQGVVLVLGKILAGTIPQHDADLFECVLFFGVRGCGRVLVFAEGVGRSWTGIWSGAST
jgi:hypothetical protein